VQALRAQADIAANIAANVASGVTSLSGAAVLCAVIAFHELGHFLAAKVQGIRINDFSIGFGPRIFGFEVLSCAARPSVLYTPHRAHVLPCTA
jgi:hypothetical protein